MATFKHPPQQPASAPVTRDWPDHEGPEPARADVDAHAHWRRVRAARLGREQERRGDPRPGLYRAAWKFFLMARTHSPERVCGWAEQAMSSGGPDGAQRERDEATALWAVHGGALREEAEEAGFAPWMASKKRPHGEAFAAWAAAFLAANRY